MVADGDVEESAAVGRLRDRSDLGRPGGKLPRLDEELALRLDRKLDAENDAAGGDDRCHQPTLSRTRLL